jgi:DNA invertase Pin-like site-specific DNA recombinase
VSAELDAAVSAWKQDKAAERDRLIRALRADGVNKRQIAIRMGISRTTVYAVLGADARSSSTTEKEDEQQ